MDKLESAVIRAEEARRVLDSPLFSAAFDDTRRAMFEALAGLDSLKDSRAVELHCMLRVMGRVRRCLETHVETGKLAEKEIQGRKRLSDVIPWRASA